MDPPFSLKTIWITSCVLGHAFPTWIQTQRELSNITLSNVQISDTIPNSLQFNDIKVVDLRHNRLHGPIPLWSNVTHLRLGNNSFSGPIPMEIGTIMSSLDTLDLSLNCLNGTIPKSISKIKKLFFIDLSQNNLSGKILDKWDSFIKLAYIDLSKNDLFGEIPTSICSSPYLFWLDLSDNSFNERLQLNLENCTGLIALNLGGNRFSGNIPRWLGNSTSLSLLSLRMNKLTGEIPQELCHFPYLHALDLSYNNLSGQILACFGNLSRLIISATDNDLPFSTEVMDFVVKRRKTEFTKNLYILNIIDLSSNNLTEEIPEEIGNLLVLGTLNFSRNQLTGKIPERIGGLKQLETLDLSHNHLSGPIPASMASLNSLSDLDLSFNNLVGSIPSSTQFSTFNNSIYEGNPGLCGSPLPKPCYTPKNEDSNKGKGQKSKGRNENEDEIFWFSVSLGLGFIVGFWCLFGSLAIKRTWRIAYFKFFDGVQDRLFVFVAVKIARLKRILIKKGEN